MNKPSTTIHSTEKYNYLIGRINVVDIETATACNRKCSYCPNATFDNASPKNNQQMSEELFTKIISDLAYHKYAGEICLQRYNEPLMDKRICDFIRIASSMIPDSTIAIYTNGDYLTLELYKKLLQSGLKKITITQHWTKISKWLQEVLNFQQEYQPDIAFKYKTLDNFWKFYNRGGEIILQNNQSQNFHCKALDAISVNVKWNVTLCCNDYHSEHIFWNANSDNIIDIYLSKEMESLRIEAITGNFSRKICQLCMWLKL